MSRVVLKNVSVKNTRDIDICVRDAFGREHILFPGQERNMVQIVEKKVNSNDRSNSKKPR